MENALEVVRQLLLGECICDAFEDALVEASAATKCSSFVLREPLAIVAVSHPALLHRNCRRHSVSELATAKTLRAIAATLKPTKLRDALLKHAQDEYRHARIFRGLARYLGKLTEQTDVTDYQWILDNDAYFVAHYNGDVTNFICDLFAGEFRTYRFLTTYVAALSDKTGNYAPKLRNAFIAVLDDEHRHLAYTAHYLNDWMRSGIQLKDSLVRGFRAYDQNSWIEVSATAEFFCKPLVASLVGHLADGLHQEATSMSLWRS